MSSKSPNLLSPRALAQAIGVSESSVKRWADSGRIRIVKTSGGHRRIPVSEAARFVRDEGLALVEPGLLGLVVSENLDSPEEPIEAALRRGSSTELRNLLAARYLAGESLAELFDGPLAKAMSQIGMTWLDSPDGILLEHRATTAARDVLVHLGQLVPEPPVGAPVAVGGAIAGDPSQLPSMMAALVLMGEGLRVIDLGANTPASALSLAAEAESARLAWLSVNHLSDRVGAAAEVAKLMSSLGSCRLIIGGAMASEIDLGRGASPMRGRTMAELAAFGAGLVSGK